MDEQTLLDLRNGYVLHRPEHLFFVKEYASGGSLVTQLQQAGVFTEETAQFYTAQIPLALKFLHKHGIFHH